MAFLIIGIIGFVILLAIGLPQVMLCLAAHAAVFIIAPLLVAVTWGEPGVLLLVAGYMAIGLTWLAIKERGGRIFNGGN